ncbi:hypothetical protein CLM86_38690, partial [Pseudomonas aeruginosa]
MAEGPGGHDGSPSRLWEWEQERCGASGDSDGRRTGRGYCPCNHRRPSPPARPWSACWPTTAWIPFSASPAC